MSMSKKDFIALADEIKEHNRAFKDNPFDYGQMTVLADFCARQNPRFNRLRWMAYIHDECGPNGGKKAAVYHSGEQCGFTCDAHKS